MHRHRVAPTPLRLIHRRVGVLEQGADLTPMLRKQCNADRRRYLRVDVRHQIRSMQRLRNARREQRHFLAVLELLAAGLRNKEIALRLHRSARTVDHHLVAIFGKLGVATRAEAVSAAYRLGVVAASS